MNVLPSTIFLRSTHTTAQKNQQLEDSLLEVPYSVFTVIREQEKMQILQAISTAINVQLTLDGQGIPFVSPINFPIANSQDKLFCYGPGGSGKSRLILELLRAKLDENIETLYIINPRQGLDKNIQRADLFQLTSQFTSHDIVVWDNYPDGLMKKDTDTGKLALEVISSGAAKNLFVALKPKFLEIYRGAAEDIPDLYSYQVQYDINQIKEIIKQYGTSIPQFKELYASNVAQNTATITKVLWQKEPVPLTILNYYRELTAKRNRGERLLDAISEAQAMLYPTSYYEYQFEQLIYSKARLPDAEFLYTVKLCYELALDRRLALVECLQSKIFGSTAPKDISRNLSSWVYLSGNRISMHDVPRDAIKFNDRIRLKIIDYLIGNFSDIVSDNEEQLHSIGEFLGRNIQPLLQHSDSQEGFLPNTIYQVMKSHRRLEVAIGQGAGEVFYSLDQPLQQEILDRIEKDGEFARGLGESLGKSFEDLDGSIRTDILSMRIGKSILFARGLGESLGHNFYKLSESLQEEVFQISVKEKNYNFQRGLGAGLGRNFRYLTTDVQKRLLDLTSHHIALAIGVGYGLALDYTTSHSISKEFQNDIKEWMKVNAEITRGLGMGLGQNYPFLNRVVQSEILSWTDNDPRLEFGFAYQLSFFFMSMTKEYQDLIFNRVGKISEFGYGAGWGFGVVYSYLQKQMQQRLLDLAKRNMRFATGLGAGIGNQLQYLTKEIEEELFTIIENNGGFATGAAFGMGRSFSFLRQELQHKVWHLMQTNYSFAVGLGWGLGFAYSYLQEELQYKVLEYVQKEPGFACGFGWGLGFMFTYLSEDLQQKANLLASQNSQFAFGLGLGLGSLLNYLPQDLRQGIWTRAERCAQFAAGLGSELGYLFSYLPAHLQQDILFRSESNSYLARGLGWGLGGLFTSLPEDQQQYLLRETQRNHELLRGLGWGLGSVWAYLSAELQKTIVRMAGTNLQFAIGLGEGMGHSFQHLDSQLRQWAIRLSCENDAIARGLGFGLGHIMKYLDSESAHEVWRRAEHDAQFAIGLGEGLGGVIGFLPLSSQKEIFAKMKQNTPLARGLGSGLGNYAPFHLPDKGMSANVSAFIKENKDFSRGYGEGLGRIFSYWTESMLDDVIMPIVSSDTQFAIGLGEGVGQSLPYDKWRYATDRDVVHSASMNSDKGAATLEKLFTFDGFLYGVGFGFSGIIKFIPEKARTLVFPMLLKYQNFALALGYGLGRGFPSLDQKLQEHTLALGEKSREVSIGLGQGIGISFKYLEAIMQQGLLVFAEKNGGFAIGLGQGVGSNFPLLNEKLQGEMLDFAKKSEDFAGGLSEGLSHSVMYLDETLQRKLASFSRIKDYSNGSTHEPEKKDASVQFHHPDHNFLMLSNRPYVGDAIDKSQMQESELSKESPAEILFSGRREKYCICYIDMMNSTQISSTLDDSQLSRYYGTFLNSMATIAKNFRATIIKNAGDCLIFYFPSTSNSANHDAFKDVIECGITMISAHQAINAKLFDQKLPPLNYRISADYGKVELARSSSSQSDDLFGSTMNVCAKINPKAPVNGMGIGQNLYQVVSDIMENEYDFEKVGEYSGFKEAYHIYSIKPKQKRNILNPFRRRAETLLDSRFANDNGDDFVNR